MQVLKSDLSMHKLTVVMVHMKEGFGSWIHLPIHLFFIYTAVEQKVIWKSNPEKDSQESEAVSEQRHVFSQDLDKAETECRSLGGQ